MDKRSLFDMLDKNSRVEMGSAREVILICGEGKRWFSVQLITVVRNDIFGCEGSKFMCSIQNPPYLFSKIILFFPEEEGSNDSGSVIKCRHHDNETLHPIPVRRRKANRCILTVFLEVMP